MVNTKICYL